MTSVYIFGSICGIAVLFLLKFMQVVSKELRGFSPLQKLFSLTRGEYVRQERRWWFGRRKTNLRASTRFLPHLHGRPDGALSVVTPIDRRSGESRAVLRCRTGRFHSWKPGLQGVGTLVEQAGDN